MPYHFTAATHEAHQFLDGPFVRVPKELGCAFAASALVSPIVSIMDKAMVQEIKGIVAFFGSIGVACKEMICTPKKFFGGLSFRLTLFVYFGTYAVANCCEAALDFYNVREEQRRKQLKVSAASAANISLLAWRDSVFAREFSGGTKPATPKKTPIRTVGLFATRDFFTMVATFYAAPKAAHWLTKEHDVNREVAELSMALCIPVITQVLTAPLHIHAMDFYTRSHVMTTDSLAKIRAEFKMIAFARGLRILPAFGIGSYSNNKFRELTIHQPTNADFLLRRKVTKFAKKVIQQTTHNDELKLEAQQFPQTQSTM
jgi:hypothetical protein